MSTQNTTLQDPIIEPESELLPVVAKPEPPKSAPVTATQARIEAVAELTKVALMRAGTLQLTPEESKALSADFPDDAFQPGASGKENLIYIEHAALRDRFNSVLGLGQWAIIVRETWQEDFVTPPSPKAPKGVKGVRVYCRAMLLVRGCYVGESVGDMDYFPSNASQNYGDAFEGSKTAAFRRCAKEFGVGLQAWRKEWCNGWWLRKRHPERPTQRSAVPERPAKQNAPAGKPEANTVAEESKITKFLRLVGPVQHAARGYAVREGWILPNESLLEIPEDKLPKTQAEFQKIMEQIQAIADMDQEPLPEAQGEPEPSDNDGGVIDDGSEWRTFPMPWGNYSGEALGDLDKKYLFGLWANYVVETTYNGKPKKPETIAKDKRLRQMLDDAGEHYGFTKKEGA